MKTKVTLHEQGQYDDQDLVISAEVDTNRADQDGANGTIEYEGQTLAVSKDFRSRVGWEHWPRHTHS